MPRRAAAALRSAGGFAYHRLRRAPVVGPIVTRLLGDVARRTVRVRAGPLAGLEVEVDPRVQADAAFGAYEHHVVEALTAALPPGGLAFDVGAHLGYLSLVMARVAGRGGRVVCFEPDPEVFAGLVANLARNGGKVGASVTALNAAAGPKAGTARFSPGAHSTRGRLSNAGNIAVEVRTLDDEAARWGCPDVVKVDVEGGELKVLEGSSGLIARRRTTFVVEVHSPGLAEACRERLGPGYDCRPLAQPGRAESYLVAVPA